jgi:hypothetical protein
MDLETKFSKIHGRWNEIMKNPVYPRKDSEEYTWASERNSKEYLCIGSGDQFEEYLSLGEKF